MFAVSLFIVLMTGAGPFERPNPGIEEGNRLIATGKFAEALRNYEGEEGMLTDRAELPYNKGLALYHMKDFSNAKKEMSGSLRMPDRRTQEMALFNLGNADYRMGNYAEAAEAYKNALLSDPSDKDAKINLELALKKMKESQKSQEPQKHKKGDEEKPQQGSEDPQKPQNKEESRGSLPHPGSLSKEEALQVLNSLTHRGVNLQPQKNMLQDRGTPLVDKDW